MTQDETFNKIRPFASSLRFITCSFFVVFLVIRWRYTVTLLREAGRGLVRHQGFADDHRTVFIDRCQLIVSANTEYLLKIHVGFELHLLYQMM
uniref:Uncharacterized protein n=1 Tax=Romanomermis culicivorax TaxID=13658 RepID=A0A915K8L8_ROMCU